ncbi:MAG: hypothetical protein AAFX87_26215 [Bacteroidota bacterium]
MRVVKEIPHPACKITVFAWNGKYLIKLEQGDLEQTFKVSELELTSEDELTEIVNDDFMNKALERFGEMRQAFGEAMQNL